MTLQRSINFGACCQGVTDPRFEENFAGIQASIDNIDVGLGDLSQLRQCDGNPPGSADQIPASQ